MFEPCHAASKRSKTIASDTADEFDATLLHNRVYEHLQGQCGGSDDLIRLLDLAERAYDLAADRDDVDGRMDIFGAAEDLNDQVDAVVAEEVARACAVVLDEGNDWTDVWDQADVDDAVFEARQWLQANHEAAKRAGVWEEVTAHA